MMAFSRPTARDARAIALAAATFVAATAPVAAETFAQKQGIPAECAHGSKADQLKCGTIYYQKKTAAANARGAAADARGAAADARSAAAERQTKAANAGTSCIDRVVREAGDPKALSSEQKAAVRAKILACG